MSRGGLLAVSLAGVLAAAAPARAAMIGADGALLSGPSAEQRAQFAPDVIGQFFLGGRRWCFYGDGWRGPGWYWCGYGDRDGYGWGGGPGWNGWDVPGYPVESDDGDYDAPPVYGGGFYHRDYDHGRDHRRFERREGQPYGAGGGFPHREGGGFPHREGGGFPHREGGDFPHREGGGFPHREGGGGFPSHGGGGGFQPHNGGGGGGGGAGHRGGDVSPGGDRHHQ